MGLAQSHILVRTATSSRCCAGPFLNLIVMAYGAQSATGDTRVNGIEDAHTPLPPDQVIVTDDPALTVPGLPEVIANCATAETTRRVKASTVLWRCMMTPIQMLLRDIQQTNKN